MAVRARERTGRTTGRRLKVWTVDGREVGFVTEIRLGRWAARRVDGGRVGRCHGSRRAASFALIDAAGDDSAGGRGTKSRSGSWDADHVIGVTGGWGHQADGGRR